MMFVYDYLPYLGPPLTQKQREEYGEIWEKLREEGRGVEPPTLAAIGFKPICQPLSGTFQDNSDE
jgi:hypothetical protein